MKTVHTVSLNAQTYIFTFSSVLEFSPELTHHLLGWRESGQGDLQVQVIPMQGLVGALESRCTTQAKKVKEINMRWRPLSLCCQTVLSISDFLALVILIFPPSFCQALNRHSYNSCVLFCFFLFFCILWFKENVPVFALASLPLPVAIGKIYKSVWRIIIFKHHIWMPKCVQTISVNATCLRLI